MLYSLYLYRAYKKSGLHGVLRYLYPVLSNDRNENISFI